MTEDRWVVRNVDEADRHAAVAAAERADMTTAEWLGLAIREKLAREHTPLGEGEIVTDDEADDHAPADRRLVLLEPMTPISIEDIGRVVAIAEKLAALAGGKARISRRIAAQVTRLLLARLTSPMDNPPSQSG
jgi:hypothetical protein